MIRNTNTAMGKALEAMGGVSLAQDADTKSAPAQKQETRCERIGTQSKR